MVTIPPRGEILRFGYMRRVATVLTAALGLTMFTSVAPSETVSAARSDVVAIVLEGTGNGHGRGMSQWGAYGWAVDEGKDWTWILDHYYGGTAMGNVNTAQARIRVRLTALDGLGTVGVTSSSGGVQWGGQTQASMYAKEVSPNTFQVFGTNSRACPTSSTLVVPNGPVSQGSDNSTAVRQIQTFLNAFRIAGDATLTVDGDFGNLTRARLEDWQRDQSLPSNGVWDSDDAARARQLISAGSGSAAWTLLGTKSGPIVFTKANGENSAAAPTDVLGVCNSSGRVTHYRGKIEVRSESGGNRVVNDVKTEDYLRGVVPKEISASWADAGGGRGMQAVRAQAVAARSYGLQQNRYPPYATICDTQSCQVYGGAATRSTATALAFLVEDQRTDASIAATAGKVRKWPNGSIVSTEFSASNGPRTAGGAFPPVDDAAGDDTPKNPNHRWTRIIDADTLASKYGLGSLTAASMVEAADSKYRVYDGIWFNDIVLSGTGGTKRMQAWDFRGAFGLPSPGFTVRVITEDTTGKSFGIIGDSVANGVAGSASSEFRTLIDGTYKSTHIDVVTSRCTTKTACPGTSGVEAAAKLPSGLDLVVVELGYNDSPSGFAADIDAMMNALRARNVREVVWVNMAEIRKSASSSYYAQSNAALRAAAAKWSNLTLIDWDSASNTPERSRWFASDGVHLTTTGESEFSLWLRSEVLAATPSHWLAPPEIIKLPVVGEKLVAPGGQALAVPRDAVAVALNITIVDPIRQGHATVWPCGGPKPTASNVNFKAGTRIANGVIAPIGTDGKVCIYSHAGTDLVVDVAGWFPAASAAGAPAFVGVTPLRLIDTRYGTGGRTGRVTPTTPLKIPVVGTSASLPGGGTASVPDKVTAVALNVTAVDPIRSGFVTVWPCGVERPVASNLNFVAGSRVANGVIAPVGPDGSVCLYAHAATDVVVDIAGWFSEGADGSSGFLGAVPKRIVDTRDGTGGRSGHVTPATPLSVPVRGLTVDIGGSMEAIPSDASAVAINLTIVDSVRQAHATVWPCGVPKPTASNVNFTAGTRVANGVVAPIGADGSVCIYVHGDAHVVVDISGWFAGGADPGFVGSTPKRIVDTRYAVGPIPI
jgi:peptidoglycan hydrolase-like amidase